MVEVEVEAVAYDKADEVEVDEMVDDVYSFQQKQSSIIISSR